MSVRRVLFLIWLCFVLRGSFYACALPLWEGFDEYSHFARVEYLATTGHEPTSNTLQSDRIGQSMAQLPVPGFGMPFDEYWRRPPEDRHIAPPQDKIYEAQQPPVFYWIAAAFYKLSSSFSLAAHVITLRVLCVLLASFAIPATYRIAQRILANEQAAISAAALAAALPLFTYTATHVANDSLAIACGAFVAMLALDVEAGQRNREWFLAAAIAVALLTKAYFLAFLPPIGLLLLPQRTRRQAVIAIGGAFFLCGWWFYGNLATTGSLTGNFVLVKPSLKQMALALPAFPLRVCLDFIWTTFLWTGGWSFLSVRSWMYHLFALAALAPLAGIGLRIRRGSFATLILAAFPIVFLAALLYFGLAMFSAGIGAGTHGWYACCAAPAVAVLVIAGLHTILPSSVKPYAAVIPMAMLSALELFAVHVYLLPYYTGFISHTPSGGLPAMKLSQYALGEMFGRLTLGKPAAVTGSLLIALWIVFLLATAALTAIALVLARQQRTPR